MIRQDTTVIPLQQDAHILVFFKDLSTGRGVSFSLYVHDIECVKYDCQGPNGHFHIYHTANQSYETKRMFPSHTGYWGQDNQIDYALSDFEHNIDTYLQQSLVPEIQTFTVCRDRLDEAIANIRDELWTRQEKHVSRTPSCV